jgi:isocitrate dehydrogenase kinase/phosphatase
LNASIQDLTPTSADFAARAEATLDKAERIALATEWILREFDDYYAESRQIPGLAEVAFDKRDHGTSVTLSRKRLSLYSVCIERLGAQIKEVFPELAEDETLWDDALASYLPAIEGRYAADLAFAFVHSVRRRVYQGEWKPVEYAFGEHEEATAGDSADVYRVFPCAGSLSADTVRSILEIPTLSTPWRDLEGDADLIAERVRRVLASVDGPPNPVAAVDMVDAGFYRNRGAYLVGRIILEDGTVVPLILALLNEGNGVYVDAVLNFDSDAHNLFSSTMANFHATNPRYHELAAFLRSIMPTRPPGLHYSTIGFNHVGKVAVMNELRDELIGTGEVLQTAVGFRGTVAIGFSSPSSNYNLKVIRNEPTKAYKWGAFEGIDAVMKKYARVHEINRTGSMLDNIIYYNLKLDRSWFEPALLEELLEKASQTVFLQGDAVILKYLIVQRRLTPLPVFLETASRADAETAIVNLGHCIKNNAAANIFNKDLDARNYGVSRFLKIYLFDYDALEPFTEVKIRTNEDRFDGEEDVPDWYFEDGVVFLPEEIEAGLRIPDRALRRRFREAHGDLLTTQYWERIQENLHGGNVPSVRTYPEERALR